MKNMQENARNYFLFLTINFRLKGEAFFTEIENLTSLAEDFLKGREALLYYFNSFCLLFKPSS